MWMQLKNRGIFKAKGLYLKQILIISKNYIKMFIKVITKEFKNKYERKKNRK